MRSPENLEAPNSSETHGGAVSTSSQSSQRALGGVALRGATPPSSKRALGGAALSGVRQKSAESLERAASQLELIATKLVQVAQSTQDYQRKVSPIAQGVEQEVGGSATGMDKQISGLLNAFTRDVGRSASASQQAAQIAKKLAVQARTEAQEIRRQQEADRQRGTRR